MCGWGCPLTVAPCKGGMKSQEQGPSGKTNLAETEEKNLGNRFSPRSSELAGCGPSPWLIPNCMF